MLPIRDELREPILSRFQRGAVALAGRIVMLVSVWSSMLLISIAALHVLNPDRTISAVGLVQWAIAAVVCAGAVRLGLKLTRGQRNLVLFLRKFGNREAITAASRSVATAMRRRWRLITLDDTEIEPIGVPEARHWVLTALAAVGILLMLSAGASAAAAAFQLQNVFGGEGYGLVGAYILMGLIQLVATEGNRAFAARAANSGKARRLSQLAELDTLAQHVRTLSGRVVAPPLMVVTVDDRIWREAVEQLAAVSTTVLIDISDPSENLLWEIKTLRPDLEQRWAFICEERRFGHAGDAEPGVDQRGRLEDMLAGEEVLLYSASDARRLRHFSRMLRRRLESKAPTTAAG